MSKYQKVSDKLIRSLKSYGIPLDKPAATNAIIIAVAEAYGLGEENGIIIGKNKVIEEIESMVAIVNRANELDLHLLEK